METRNCPNCSAPLNYDPASGFYACPYCGGRFAGNSEIERAIFDSAHAEEQHRREMELEKARHAHAEAEMKRQLELERERTARAERSVRTTIRMERARSREPLRGCGGPARITLSVIAIVWLLAVTLLVFGPAGCVSGMGIGMGVFLTLILAGPAVIYLLVSVIMTFTRKR